MPRKYVAVCGASDATASQLASAREVGRLLAESGVVVINGGLGGVSGAASEGAAQAGGTVVGILPDIDRSGANPHLSISLPTGMGQARNVLIVTAAESAINRRWLGHVERDRGRAASRPSGGGAGQLVGRGPRVGRHPRRSCEARA